MDVFVDFTYVRTTVRRYRLTAAVIPVTFFQAVWLVADEAQRLPARVTTNDAAHLAVALGINAAFAVAEWVKRDAGKATLQ